MVRTDNGDKSGGIEIISIGNLYAGPWDKKYWSSSRGKDRYPYPVGYKSMRTQNAVTYMMEIVEGLKGPSFTICSSDGRSCSGDTPDIAWERFQRKDAQRKLCRGKRFSSTIDGVEFFGFKNNYVQRLLRELVANIGGTSEQSLLQSNFSNKVDETNDKQEPKESNSRQDPDLLVYLDKSCVTRKRSRKEQADNSKQLAGTWFKQQKQKEGSQIAMAANSNRRDIPSCVSSGRYSSGGSSEASDYHCNAGEAGTENKTILMKNKKCLRTEGEFVSYLSDIDVSVSNSTEASDRSREAKIKDKDAQEETKLSNSTYPSLPVVNDADLFAPDTLDQTAVISSFSCPSDHLQVQEIANAATEFEGLIANSTPEVETGPSASATCSEKCYTDSVDQEIATSMMTVLLPRVLPLLKTYSRKRKNVSKRSTVTVLASRKENSLPICERSVGGGSNLGIQKENNSVTYDCQDQDLVASNYGNLDIVVSDSFDDDDPRHLLQHSTKACPEPCAQQPINDKAEANSLLCRSRDNDISIRCETETVLTEKQKTDARRDDGPLLATADTTTPLDKRIIANSVDPRSDCHSIDGLPYLNEPTLEGKLGAESMMCSNFFDMSLLEKCEVGVAVSHKSQDCADRDNFSSNIRVPIASSCSMREIQKVQDDMRLNFKPRMIVNNDQQGLLKLSACYVHPVPISRVQLIVKDTEIFIFVICGNLGERESIIFLYKVPLEGGHIGCPSLIGHAPVALQPSRSAFGKNIDIKGSLLQLAPDLQSIVLLNIIKTPYCREGNLLCACPACASDSLQENAVKIIRLNSGHASFVSKLETNEAVLCLLVCEPKFLLAAEEGGNLKLWIMNSDWSGMKECCYVPPLRCVFPGIVELKRVPKSETLVIGHNGYGEFGIWDIDRRNLISMFSSPGISVYNCLPVSIFRFERRGECQLNKQIEEIMDATKTWCLEGIGNHVFSPNDENVGVWLLISTDSDPNCQFYRSSERNAIQEDHNWRLALLINGTVITGGTVDRGVAAVTYDGHGIIGRSDGQVYIWELSTGAKLANLRHITGGQISTIVTDNSSNSSALGIACGTQLLIYLPQ